MITSLPLINTLSLQPWNPSIDIFSLEPWRKVSVQLTKRIQIQILHERLTAPGA